MCIRDRDYIYSEKALTGTVGTTQQTEQEYTFTNVGLGGLVIKKLEQGTEKGLPGACLLYTSRCV